MVARLLRTLETHRQSLFLRCELLAPGQRRQRYREDEDEGIEHDENPLQRTVMKQPTPSGVRAAVDCPVYLGRSSKRGESR